MKTVRTSFLLSTMLFSCLGTVSAQQKLHQLWQTDQEIATPESVLIDPKQEQLYVTLIGPGSPAELDGNGSVGKIDYTGKVITADWIKGLHSPKGFGIHQNHMYVCDLQEIVLIDVKKAKILKKIPIPGAGMMNDLSIDQQSGRIFASDSKGGKIYELVNDKPIVFLDHLTNPNGVLAQPKGLYYVDSGSLYWVDQQKKVMKIASGMLPSTDGLQLDGENFLISCWAGAIYYVKKDGHVDLLMDSQSEKTNTADFAFDPASRILYLPTFFKNYVAAYHLE